MWWDGMGIFTLESDESDAADVKILLWKTMVFLLRKNHLALQCEPGKRFTQDTLWNREERNLNQHAVFISAYWFFITLSLENYVLWLSYYLIPRKRRVLVFFFSNSWKLLAGLNFTWSAHQLTKTLMMTSQIPKAGKMLWIIIFCIIE